MSTRPDWKLPAALAGTLLVAGTGVYWYEYSKKPKLEEAEEAGKKLLPIKDRSVSLLRLTQGGKTLEARCLDLGQKLCKAGDNSRWELTQPVQVKADDASVNGLLSAINNLEPTETIDLKDDSPEKRTQLMAQYGLDAASRAKGRTLELVFGDGKTQVAQFGETHPISDGLFTATGTKSGDTVSLSDSKVYVTPTFFKTSLDRDLTYWRDKKVLSMNASQVTGFQLNGTRDKVSVDRKDGNWTLAGGLPGDIENIDAIITAATYLTAKGFVSESKNDPKSQETLKGLKPALTLTLNQQDAKSPQVTLTLYSRPAKGASLPAAVYATSSSSDPLYELDQTAIGRLDKTSRDLRLAKLITSMDRYGTKKIEVEGTPLGGKTVALTQKDGKWFTALDHKEASSDRVQTLLDRLTGNRIQEYLSGSAVPAGEKDAIRITLSDDKGVAKRKLAFWQAGGKLYARDLGSKRPEVFQVDSSIVDTLPWDPNFLFVPVPAKAQAQPHPGHEH